MNSEHQPSEEIDQYLSMLDDIDRQNLQRVKFRAGDPNVAILDRSYIVFHTWKLNHQACVSRKQ